MSILDFMSQQQSPSLGGTGGIGALGAGNSIYPQSRMDKTQYATPMQLPTSAEVISSDYDPKIDAYTGMPSRFAKGGIAGLCYDEGGDVDVSGKTDWNPESGTVKLQQLEDPKDPFSPVKSLVDYTIPKDQVKTFVPDTDLETGATTGAGQYILKDGSTMHVDNKGIVQAATPGRDEYTLNKEGYYQPTGSGLDWRGDQNMLYKKIGGVDVQVPGIFHKGGYQDQKGNLRVDENGVPVPLRPNYLDSGFGQSGLSDAAPYIMAAALGGAGLAMAPGIAGAGFAGMVPASETLLGSMGYLGATAAPAAGSGSWGLSPSLAAELGLEGSTTGLTGVGASGDVLAGMGIEGAGSTAGGFTDASLGYKGAAEELGLSGSSSGLTDLSGKAGSATLDSMGLNTATAKELTGAQKYLAATMAAKGLSGGSGGSSGGGGTYTTTTQAPPQQNIASNQYYPAMNYNTQYAYNQPNPLAGYFSSNPTYKYYAQGGLADLGGYAAGGKLLKGAGDGMSDDIVANIEGNQPARLADGEFVIPADVVSHLGNGSTDAGAKQLYKMMDKIRQARTGRKSQGKKINPEKFFPKG